MGLNLNFAQGLAAAAAASQHSLAQQKLQDISLLANLSAERLDSFSRELLLGNSSNTFQLLKNPNTAAMLNAAEKRLRE